MCSVSLRSRAWIRMFARGGHSQRGAASSGEETIGLGQMKVVWLSRVVSMRSFQDKALAGAILVPGVTSQMMSKSWRKRVQQA